MVTPTRLERTVTPPAWSTRPPSTPERIADCFEVLAAQTSWFASELDEINAARPLISQSMVGRLVALGERMKPVAIVRDHLNNLDPAHLQAGIELWLSRQNAEASPDSNES